jgi:SAM-dependent methyltransferase
MGITRACCVRTGGAPRRTLPHTSSRNCGPVSTSSTSVAGPATSPSISHAARVRAAVGVDAAATIIDAARTAAKEQGVAGVEFEVADVYELPFADATFDVVHAHQVLQHLADPVAALRQMRRVCRAEGVVAARDSDYETFTWYPASPGLTRWLALYCAIARGNRGEPDAGRFLLRWAHEAGFSEVTPSASVWCFATPEDRAWWGGLWADRITVSALGDQIVERGLATRAELDEIATAWREWSDDPDGWFAVLHGEILCRP